MWGVCHSCVPRRREIIGLFCKRALWKRLRSHPIVHLEASTPKMNNLKIRFSILTEILTTVDRLSPGTFQMRTERSQSKLRIGGVAGTNCALMTSHSSLSQYVLQCVAVCCSVLQCVAVCCFIDSSLSQYVICCHLVASWKASACVLQYVAVCCSVFQCVAVCCSVLHHWLIIESICDMLSFGCLMKGKCMCVAVCCSVLHCMLQCAATRGGIAAVACAFSVCCSLCRRVFESVAVLCSMLQRVAACCDGRRRSR